MEQKTDELEAALESAKENDWDDELEVNKSTSKKMNRVAAEKKNARVGDRSKLDSFWEMKTIEKDNSIKDVIRKPYDTKCSLI